MTNVATPVVIDLGKRKRKHIRRLKDGRGRLVHEVRVAVDEVVRELGEDGDGKEILPVVLIYRRKRKKGRGGSGLFPLL